MRFLIAVLAVIVIGLCGCTQEPAPVLRVAGNIWPGYESLYLARDLGYFHDAPVHATELTSATQVIRAFQNGTIDAACLTLDEALLLASHGEDFRIVLVADFSSGADVIVGAPSLKDMTDLRGRPVGVEDTALGAFFLARALQISGLTEKDVRIVPVEVQRHEQAFSSGEVQALVTFEPVRSRLLAGGARILFDSRRLPGEIVDVLLVRTDYLQRHPEAVTALLSGWFRAMAYVGHSPQDALTRMARREDLGVPALHEALRGLSLPGLAENRKLLDGAAPALSPVMQRLATFMLDKKLLPQAVDVHGLIDSRPLQALKL